MGVLVGRKVAYPVGRRMEKIEPKKEKESFMNELTTRYLENFRAFFEAADLHFETLTKRAVSRHKDSIAGL